MVIDYRLDNIGKYYGFINAVATIFCRDQMVAKRFFFIVVVYFVF